MRYALPALTLTACLGAPVVPPAQSGTTTSHEPCECVPSSSIRTQEVPASETSASDYWCRVAVLDPGEILLAMYWTYGDGYWYPDAPELWPPSQLYREVGYRTPETCPENATAYRIVSVTP